MPPDIEIWLDHHFSPIVAKWLNDDLGWNVKSSWATKIAGMNDLDIFLKAKNAGKNVILITKDADFTRHNGKIRAAAQNRQHSHWK